MPADDIECAELACSNRHEPPSSRDIPVEKGRLCDSDSDGGAKERPKMLCTEGLERSHV